MLRTTCPTARLFSAIIALGVLLAIGSAAAAELTLVEHVTSNPAGPTDGLATAEYRPSDKERPFFERLAPDEIKTGSLAEDYDITKRAGRYVGWFGIVRQIAEDVTGKQTVLTVEHKYFDGLTDSHIQALSFNGSGDFLAVLNGPGHEIPLLALVNVYGTVAPAAVGRLPRVDSAFVRVWHWGTFTFLDDWGQQRGSQRWRQLNQVALDDIYEPYPSRVYYEQRLGKLAGSEPARRRLLQLAGPMTPALETRVKGLTDSVLAADDQRLRAAIKAVLDLRGEEAALAVLIECLKNPDPWVRGSVVQGFDATGPKAVPGLIAALQADTDWTRASAALALIYLGPDARDAVPALTASLADCDPEVRGNSAQALGRVGRAAGPAAAGLQRLLSDPSAEVRLATAEALWRVTVQPQPAVGTLAELLKDKNPHVRWDAADKLSDIGPEARDAVPGLIARLADEYAPARFIAADALGSIGSQAQAAVPALIAALGDKDESVRANAADSLGQIGADAPKVVPALVAATTDADDFVRLHAVSALGEFGPAAAPAMRALVKILKEDSAEMVRGVAGRELARIDPTGKAVMPVLIENLRDSKPAVRRFAAWALADLGPVAADAVKPLTEAIQDPEPVVRVYAAGALWKIAQQDAVAVPVLVEALRSDDFHVRRSAAQNVIGAGMEAVRAVPALVENLRCKQLYIQCEAAAALGRIGPAAKAAVGPLVEMLQNEREDIGVSAAEALWRIRGDDESLERLIAALASRNTRAQCDAATALGEIGPPAKAAKPALKGLLEHEDSSVRQAAVKALQRIAPSAAKDK